MVTSTTQKKTAEDPAQTSQNTAAQAQANAAATNGGSATQDQANASTQPSTVIRSNDGVSGTVVGGQQKVEAPAPVVKETPAPKQNVITEDYIRNFYQQMQEQATAQNKYTVEQAVLDLQRAQEDAQKGFRQQQNQVNIDEAQARDAHVLYAAARGDRGGITARQYDSIANTAAKNRTAVQQAQQQLATDTARQIADLRARGEFEQANNVLKIAQQQLAQLWDLQQYEDNKAVQEKQLAMSEANLTGKYNGEKTYAAQEAERSWAYDIAMQNIQLGVLPEAGILAAAGIDPRQAELMAYIYAQATGNQAFIDMYNASKNPVQNNGGYGGGGFGGYGGGSNKVSFDAGTDYQALINDAVARGDLNAAAKYETQRNAKIAAMNAAGTNTGGYTQTNIYTGDGSKGDPGGNPTDPGSPSGDPNLWTFPGGDSGPALNDTMYQRALEGFASTLKPGTKDVENLVSNAMNTLGANFTISEEQKKGFEDLVNNYNKNNR